MTLKILDTSVAIAWYLPEVFSDRAKFWREQMLGGKVQLLVPSLHYIEFANVIRTYVRRGEINFDLGSEIYQIHIEAPLEIAELQKESLLDIAIQYEATAYDALYISLALSYSTQLLTGEKTTTPWVVKLGDLVEVVR